MATNAIGSNQFRIEPQLEKMLPRLTEEEFSQLEKNILSDSSRIVLVLWREQNVLLDGHNRYRVCLKHNLPYETVSISLPDMDAAQLWMIHEHIGRRNFSGDQKSYWRGKQYELEKKSQHRPENNGLKMGPLRTREKLAEQHHVSRQTVERDGQFAKAVDAIAKAAGNGAKDAILSGDMKITRQEVQKLSEVAQAQPQTAKNVLAQIAAEKPKEAKRIVQEAARQMPKPAVNNGGLFPQIKAQKTIETVQLNGRPGYIVHDSSANSVFNQTNDMVDWASWTWNPVTGCWHGCDYCYARAIANDERMKDIYPHKFEPTFHESRLKAPANTSFPKELSRPADRNVFVCSMADLFGKWVPDEWIARVFEQVSHYDKWNYLFLTKFPQRLRSVCDDLLHGFPDNAWVGCTVDGQARVKTAQESFSGLRAKVRWLSVEPMQERLTFTDMSMFDWLVVGGKSASAYNGTPAEQPQWEWVEDLLGQARRAGVAVYFKENLTVKPKEVPWS